MADDAVTGYIFDALTEYFPEARQNPDWWWEIAQTAAKGAANMPVRDPRARGTGGMSNAELAARIVGDLNDLIDVRGNTSLIPALIVVKGFKDECDDLTFLANMMGAHDDEVQS